MFYVWNTERVTPDSATNYLTHVAFLQEVQLCIPRPDWKRLPLLARVKRGSRIRFGKQRNRKQPLTYRLATRIRGALGLDPDTVTHDDYLTTLYITIMFTGIGGLFRLGELLPAQRKNADPAKLIRRGQIHFFNQDFPSAGTTEVARVWLFKSKTDIFSEGTPVYVPACSNDNLNCPVRWIKATLRLTKTASSTRASPLFTNTKGQILLKQNFTKWLKLQLTGLGFDCKKYSGHSLRIGGAQSLQRAHVPHHLIQTIGRWRSNAYLLYLKHEPTRLTNLRHHIQRLSTVHNDC